MAHRTATSSGITLRTVVTPQDVAAVRAIAESTGYFSVEELDVAMELLDDRLEQGEASEYQFIIADIDRQPVGFASFGLIACTIGSYDLYWIAVHEQHRGNGIGKQLMAEVERRIAADGGRRIYVETSSREQYEPTRRFYEAGGYRVDATQHDYYAPGDGKVTFVKTL